jgi:transposase
MTDYTKLVKALREYSGCRKGEIARITSDAAAAIEALQAQLPKRGEWVEENRRPRSSQFVCSECHRTAYDPQPTRDKAWKKRCRYAYCPNCGAKMEVQDADS